MNAKRLSLIFAAVLFAVAVVAMPAAAGTLSGSVRNLTTGGPAANQDVVLMELTATMAAIATTRTDAAGRFRFEHPDIGRIPVLLRVTYRGVNYHTNVPPGQATADIEVYEATADPAVMEIATRFVVVQPNGPELLVGEEFMVHNHSTPPQAYFRPEGTFEFLLPEGAELVDVSAWGAAGMPTVQGTISKGANRYAIAFPIRPGQNGIRLSYQMPYPANRLTLRTSSPYPAQRVTFVAPPTVRVEGQGLVPAGSEQGWNLFTREALPANTTLEVAVSGTAPPPSAEPAGQPAGMGGQIQMLPARLDSLRWILIAGFGALFALGLIYLLRKPRMAPATAGAPAAVPPPRRAAKAPPAAGAVEEVERHVSRSLDELKDHLFRLELRRQAGTISEEEYAAERARTEQQLRELVRG